jgi:phosphoribosylcarboxyaminoimidazole (NCAIR) mutase
MSESHRHASRALAYAGLAAAAFTGLDVGIRMASEAAGVWGVVAASALFPLTIAGAPLLALLWGQWIPAVVVYGGGVAAAVLYARYERGEPAPDFPATS